MIRDILLNSKARRQLYKNKLVCGCVYRSFNELEAGIFFKFATCNGKLARPQIRQMVSNNKQEALDKFMAIIRIFRQLQIIKSLDDINYELNSEFVKNLEQFLKQQRILQPVSLNPKPQPSEPKPFEFIEIIFENQLPQRCKLTSVNTNNSNLFTKQQFTYIKSDISYKISILIDGIINSPTKQKQQDNIRNIESLVLLNLLDSQEYYQRTQKLNPLLIQLAKIKLVQLTGQNNKYFRISKYLEHFTFKTAKQRSINTKLNCRVIIETNFKVFAEIKSQDPKQIRVIKKILDRLLKRQRDGVECQQFFIGEINEEFMKNQIFGKMNITTNQYFDFFKQYTDQNQQPQKDLGKWKKLKFIGLDGPCQQSSIPSNIKQQVKLWELLKSKSQN